MKPNNQYTSPEIRFFYPVNHSVEHHESLDTSGLPRTVILPGTDHFVHIRPSDESGEQDYAACLFWEKSNISGGSTIVGIKGREPGALRYSGEHSFVPADEFEIFNESYDYSPEATDGTFVIVQLDKSWFQRAIRDPRFDDEGVAILPLGTPLPTFDGLSTRYRVLGFISEDDQLVTWQGENSYTVQLVDWCVANALKQNRMEEALLRGAVPNDMSLIGLLDTNIVAKAYLRYFDSKHATAYLPGANSLFPYTESEFEPLNSEQFDTYLELSRIAGDAWNQAR